MDICGSIEGVAPFLGVVLVAGLGSLATLACIVAALRMLIDPGETEADHPKRRILALDR